MLSDGDKNSFSDRMSIREKGLVCQRGECHNIWRLDDRLSLVGIGDPPMDMG